MPFTIYLGWDLLVLLAFSVAYGMVTHRLIGAMQYARRDTAWYYISVFVFPVLVFVAWGMVNIPLPIFYLVIFLGKLARAIRDKESQRREFFLISLAHLASMALHMILIAVAALCLGSTAKALLEQPFWRIFTLSVVLATNVLVGLGIPRLNMVLEVLRTQSDTAEVKNFMVFLLFCNATLLLDSVLCISDIEWGLLPVFLIGSAVLVEFYLIRFIKHLYAILKERYLEEEHGRLVERLGRQSRDAAELRSKTVKDSMTGVFSRRYGMERTEAFLKAGTPFSFVFIDLDHLKRINDQEGHHAGDQYLIRFAREFSSRLRKTDVFARVGGDEFIVLFPNCTPEAATQRMEDIRVSLVHDCSTQFLFSYGVTHASGDAPETVEQIIRRADQAMYRDKQEKRNRG